MPRSPARSSPPSATHAYTVAEAVARIRARVATTTASEWVDLTSALGRVTARDVISPANVPNHTNSAMDGYAVRAADLAAAAGEVVLQIIGRAVAGRPFHGEVAAGQCVRIMTGAVMPYGTDHVVIQEQVMARDTTLTITPAGRAAVSRGANVRAAGEDLAAGAVAIPMGTRIRAAQLGVLASLGLADCQVYRRPTVAYFSTGDELRAVGSSLARGEVYDSNRYTLHALLCEAGVTPLDFGVVADDRAALAATLTAAAAQAEMVISTAGASVGEADYMRELLAQLGQVEFMRVAVKPGRPLSFGRLGDAWFFGLPGNPVSVMVTFQVFVRVALQPLTGERLTAPLTFSVKTVSALSKRPGRREYQRGVLYKTASGETVVRSTGAQGSGILSSMSEANCFIILPDDSVGVLAGDWVEVQPLTATA